jgi:2-methylisocitrate lyase-like PEP mutase family enzyme
MVQSVSKNGETASDGLTPGKRLRKLLARKEILIAPGVYDGFSARIAHEIGFDCIYMVRWCLIPFEIRY